MESFIQARKATLIEVYAKIQHLGTTYASMKLKEIGGILFQLWII